MAELPDIFKTDSIEPMADFEIMPIDKPYLGEIIKSEIKKTKAGTGLRGNFHVEILESQYSNENGDDKYLKRRIFIGLNLKNPNPKAMEFSQRELKSMCDAMGFDGELEDTDDLHGIPFGFMLKVSKQEGYADKNEIKKYLSPDEYDKKVKELAE